MSNRAHQKKWGFVIHGVDMKILPLLRARKPVYIIIAQMEQKKNIKISMMVFNNCVRVENEEF